MLIDTNALIWYALEPERLSRRASRLMRESGNSYSHVSLWEMAIKSSLGKLHLRNEAGQPSDAKEFMLNMIRALQLRAVALEFDDVADVQHLPPHHKDPFDRLLVVQAQRRNLPIISSDERLDAYGAKRIW